GALLRNLDFHLSQVLGLPVIIGNPLAQIQLNATKVPDYALHAMAPYLAVALGLALPEDD
ncbi:MAG: hypothetical protein H5T84_01270, partial [Thermoleophilia bacterium]|nr:hypothetical protein [Thermoleophilia bacterium]